MRGESGALTRLRIRPLLRSTTLDFRSLKPQLRSNSEASRLTCNLECVPNSNGLQPSDLAMDPTRLRRLMASHTTR